MKMKIVGVNSRGHRVVSGKFVGHMMNTYGVGIEECRIMLDDLKLGFSLKEFIEYGIANNWKLAYIRNKIQECYPSMSSEIITNFITHIYRKEEEVLQNAE